MNPSACSSGGDGGSAGAGGCGQDDSGSVGVEPSDCVGNPCQPSSGNKYLTEVDFQSSGDVAFVRYYNSLHVTDIGLGYGWTTNLHRRLHTDGNTLTLIRANGQTELWEKVNGTWVGEPDSKLSLTEDSQEYVVAYPNQQIEKYLLSGEIKSIQTAEGNITQFSYDSNGKLSQVTGPFGHVLTFTYDDNRLIKMTDSGGKIYAYTHKWLGGLDNVRYPDGSVRRYHHENADFPYLVTGITDENNHRYATYQYDNTAKALSTEHAVTTNASGQERFTLEYASDTQTVVTDATGTAVTWNYIENLGAKKLVSKTNSVDSKSFSYTYDANNNVTRIIDPENRATLFEYNSHNQRVSSTVAAGTEYARRTEYEYISDDLDFVSRITEPSVVPGQTQETVFVYNSDFTINSVTVSGYRPDGSALSRSVTFDYNSAGQVTVIDGPLTAVDDRTQLSYYECSSGGACGQLASLTDALGHTTTFDSYDGGGRLTQMTEPNGAITNYTYDSRGRVLTVTLTPPDGQTPRTESYSYDSAGQLHTLTAADGQVLTYSYDAAHDLRRITDGLGQYVAYRYDVKGNRTDEDIFDPNNTLVRTLQLSYDHRNHLASVSQAGAVSQWFHDALGQLRYTVDANDHAATTYSYDALQRLQQHIDALGGVTDYRYDVHGRLTLVKAPNEAATGYFYDDLGNLLTEQSPDRGPLSYSYDAAGNLLTRTDGRGITASYHYDTLNRLTSIDSPGTAADVQFSYDSCAYGLGRLCQITDAGGTTQYQYDGFGQLVRQQLTHGALTQTQDYTYDEAGRLLSQTYPDGRRLVYTRDSLGRISRIDSNVQGAVTLLAEQLTYRADGLLTGLTYGNGRIETRSYDSAGRLSCRQLDDLPETCYQYDGNGNIVQIDTAAPSAVPAGGLAGDYATVPYSNHLDSITGSGGSYTYTYDGNGNILTDGRYQYQYGVDNRLAAVIQGGVTLAGYTYNAQGQRTRKSVNGVDTYYLYDLGGRLIAESDAAGNLLKSYVYLGERPLAVIEAAGNPATAAFYFIHTDHLDTPKELTDAQQNPVWQADYAPFGKASVNLQTVTHNLRFPGQYFDAETGLHYNHHRYYDPLTGRYITSDPIGLEGGINTYAYVSNNPLNWIDPYGLVNVKQGSGGSSIGGGSSPTDYTMGGIRGGLGGLACPSVTKGLSKPLRNKMKRIRNQTAAGGNRGISGSVSNDDALRLGQEFVGPDYTVMSNGKGYVSADGLRTFRFPVNKRGVNPATGEPWSKTGRQVNFETKAARGEPPTSNVHLDVR